MHVQVKNWLTMTKLERLRILEDVAGKSENAALSRGDEFSKAHI
jgi:hypothetical protein